MTVRFSTSHSGLRRGFATSAHPRPRGSGRWTQRARGCDRRHVLRATQNFSQTAERRLQLRRHSRTLAQATSLRSGRVTAARILACLALIVVAAVILGGCGDEAHSVETVVGAFADEGVPVTVGRETEGDSVLRAVLNPERTEQAGCLQLMSSEVPRTPRTSRRTCVSRDPTARC
jgi:hypothetical protein